MHSNRATQTQFIGFWALIAACGSCQQTHEETNRITGEWRIRLESDGTRPPNATAVQAPIAGAFVFGGKVANYGNTGPLALPNGASVGRVYISVDTRETISRDKEGIPFSRRSEADLLEEVAAIPTDSGAVLFAFAPKVSDYGLVLRGSWSGDTLRGKWSFSPGRDTLASGPFEMWRVGRTAITDSAIARSRRGARQWRQSRVRVP